MSRNKYSITSHYFAKKKPISAKQRTPKGELHGSPYHRLSFGDTYHKLPLPSWEFANKIREYFPKDTIYFPDTNFFTREMPSLVWTALRNRQIAITPLVYHELQPWLNKPFYNEPLCNHVKDSIQSARRSWINQLTDYDPSEPIVLTSLDKNFTDHAYDYYYDLLSIRRLIGIEIGDELKRSTGTEVETNIALDEVQRQYGERARLVAAAALEEPMDATFFADEQLIVMSAITAVCTNRETVVLTRDTAIHEQFKKLWFLINGDYRAYYFGEWAAEEENLKRFGKIKFDRPDNYFGGESCKTFATPTEEFDNRILPQGFTPVFNHCLVVGGEIGKTIVTPDVFFAECEIANFLRSKANFNGKNSSHFGECDVEVTGRVSEGQMVTDCFIFKPYQTTSCGIAVTGVDLQHTLMTNESFERIDPL